MAPQLTVMQRLEALERNDVELNEKLVGTFDRLRGQVGYAMEVLEAFTSVLTTEGVVTDTENKVEATMTAKREARKAERLAQETKQLAQMVEMGIVKPINTIGSNSLIVARSFDPKGEVQGIGREQFEFQNLHPQIKEQFLNKEVGYVFEANGNKIEVLEIYEIVPQNEVKTQPILDVAPPSGATPPPAGA